MKSTINRAKAMNLYAVRDKRPETCMCIVAAYGSEDAIRFCNNAGFEWDLAGTVTKCIQRNIVADEGLIGAVGLHAKQSIRETQI